MTLILELPDSKEKALQAKAQAHGVSAEQYVRQMVDRDLEQPVTPAAAAVPRPHISEIVRQIWSDLPDEDRAKLPVDGAAQVDHYVYGLPKRDQ